ncbi:TIGR02646 family protein [Clostridium perfringens]|uniref:retron system putative HNH endonuclease n=1 Tax=Clostridium perfringens TaxID=1502 RepID=UPI002A2D22D8|nr:TIGR02646 family protein [Clostridium perfringens]MDK0712535.1 TIGR02646 family protein [Clostridium perfringens]MDK0872464.1 TIGR02646 family protein [Clostridium perfringens]
MLNVTKEQEPDFLLEYKKKYSPKVWGDYNKDDIKARIKEIILVLEQNEYCPYCEKRIYSNDEGHIEHIRPRDLYPKEFQSYENFLVSCNEKNSCGMHKGNNYSEKFIDPTKENPTDYFYYNIASGEIVPKSNDENSEEYIKAKYTIEVLNLNSYELKNARKNLIDILDVYTGENKQYLQFFLDNRHNFPTLIQMFMEL